jgi:hypothetical protein
MPANKFKATYRANFARNLSNAKKRKLNLRSSSRYCDARVLVDEPYSLLLPILYPPYSPPTPYSFLLLLTPIPLPYSLILPLTPPPYPYCLLLHLTPSSYYSYNLLLLLIGSLILLLRLLLHAAPPPSVSFLIFIIPTPYS